MTADPKLLGKIAAVTSSGTGIGREIALEFARQGADAAVNYVLEDQGALSAENQIREMGRRSEAFEADFRTLSAARFGLGFAPDA